MKFKTQIHVFSSIFLFYPKIMERCGVCSEKNYCTLCCHCDKKVCSDCKEGHLDILRREIARVNNQVRRTLPRLQDALGVIDKNSTQLQTNCLSIIEEVDGLYRRLSKALKDRTDHIKGEIEAFMSKELKAMTGLRANLEHEISNFDSNSEFAEKHVTAGTGGTEGGSSVSSSSASTVAWDDNELMDTKDIFLRTMEFIRNFETETGDYHRRVRFFVPQDPNQLSNTLANLGELTILQGPSSSSSGQGPPTAPSLGPGLMRSKSDHRVAAAFRQQEERYNSMAYGSDNNDDIGGGSSGRPRYFGERHGSVSTRAIDRYDTSSSRRNDYGDYEEPDSGRRKFRSRFMRHHDSGDSDNEPAGRSVRFQAGDAGDPSANKKERLKVLDTEDAARGPLSGITRLTDSPRVIKRLQEVGRKKKPTPPTTLNLPTPATNQQSLLSSPSSRIPPRPTAAARQVSEEDEIAKIKKQNKGQEASSDSARKTDATPSTPTGAGERPRFSSQQSSNSSEQQQQQQGSKTSAASRQTSTTGSEASQKTPAESSSSSGATPTNETPEEARTRRRSLLAGGSKSGTSTPNDTESESRQKDRTAVASSYAAAVASRTSSPAEDTSDRASRRVGRVSTERFNKSSSESSTSAESSTHSSPVRNTGAAFSTVELKNRFGGGVAGGRKSSTGSTNGDASASMATTTTRSRFGNTTTSSGGATSPSSGRYGTTGSSSTSNSSAAASNGTAATGAAPHRFQSRFLGRAGTPTAEASRGSENSQSSSSDDSSDSSESDSAEKPANGKGSTAAGSKTAAAAPKTTTTTTTKDRELARTDIGPLLARSAQARDTSTYPSSSSTNHTGSSSGNSRPTSSDSPSSYTPRSRANASAAATPSSSSSRPYSSSSRFGTTDSGSTTGSALSRSRTGSALADDMENKYPLTSKYLNRSRANLSSDTGGGYGGGDSSGYHGSSSSSSSTPRYSQTRGYQSRFLNKSKSSAALDCAPDGGNEVADDDEEEATMDDIDDDYNKSSAVSASASASSASQPLLVVSGDERYPSGRSRYAALKDRRSRLARSKSSHDVGPPAPLSPTGPSSSLSSQLTGGDGGVAGGRASDPHYHQHGQLGGEVGDTGTSSLEPTSPSAESASGSSLSTWYVVQPPFQQVSQFASIACWLLTFRKFVSVTC